MAGDARLLEGVRAAAREIRGADPRRPIRIVGHLDADGICAAAILVKALLRMRRRHALTITPQLDDAVIDDIGDAPLVIFADIGSGQFSLLRERMRSVRSVVLDHHELSEDTQAPGTVHVNPHLKGLDSKAISGAGLAYLVATELDEKNKDLAHLAVIGALADGQDRPQFSAMNQRIVDDAVGKGMIAVSFGLRLFGRSTRPLHKVLEFSSEHQIPGVSGSENGALAFVSEMGIKPKRGGKWVTLSDLSEEEHMRLVAGIILRRSRLKNPQAILGQVFALPREPQGTPLADAREFATLLNACGRLSRASLGVGACIGDAKMKERAIEQLAEYRRKLSEAMRWYHGQGEGISRGKKYIIINAHDNVMPTMIGTLCSIIARSGELPPGTVVIGLARLTATQTKVSLRVVGKGVDLCRLAERLASKVDGRSGGHKEAAGALIPSGSENVFIEFAKSRLEK